MEPTSTVDLTSVEFCRREGVEAYRVLHEALSDTESVLGYMAGEGSKATAEVPEAALAEISALPPPDERLPLWVLAALGRHARSGQLETFYTLGRADQKASGDDADASAGAPLRHWHERNERLLDYLGLEEWEFDDRPWERWTPPAGSTGLGDEVDPTRLLEESRRTGRVIGTANAGSLLLLFVVLRDWLQALQPLADHAGVDLVGALSTVRHLLEDTTRIESAVPDVDPSALSSQLESLLSEAGVLASRVGLPTLSSWVFAATAARRLEGQVTELAPLLDDQALAAAVRASRGQATIGGYRPSARVSTDYWTIDDTLGYDLYADAIAEFIRHPETRPPLTIGITAPWGAGKTSLMRMVRARLDPNPSLALPVVVNDEVVTNAEALRNTAVDPAEAGRATTPPAPRPPGVGAEADLRPTVWFNPWTYQSSEQVWAGLAHVIIEGVTQRMTPLERERFWFELNVRRADLSAIRTKVHRALLTRLLPEAVVWGIALIALTIIAVVVPGWTQWALASSTGVAVLAAALRGISRVRSFLHESVEGSADALVRPPRYDDRTGFLHLVQSDLQRVLDLVATPSRPLVVFIDDLDRCSSSVVVDVIESLNLFLAGSFNNCIFVLAVEPDLVAAHLEASQDKVLATLKEHHPVRSWSGMGWRFLDKMVQLPLRLPAPSPEQIDRYIGSVLGTEPAATPLDLGRVEELTHTMRAELGDIESIRDVAVRADHDIAPSEDNSTAISSTEETLSPEAIRAAEIAFQDRFRDSDPGVRRIVQDHAGLLARNPRETKRFINLFRFYAFIQVRRMLRGLPAPTLEQVGKAAILTVQWPHLLTLLSDGTTDGAGVIQALEYAARQGEQQWQEAIQSLDLPEQRRGLLIKAHALRDLLAAQPDLSSSRGLI